MIFSTLMSRIQSVKEQQFYDVAIYYLDTLGYKKLRISDGSGDRGKDIECEIPGLRIQLSVRKDWKNKINEEAENTKNALKNHLLYITNRQISSQEEAEFFATSYKFKNHVHVEICDLRKISTALTLPIAAKKSYEILGLSLPEKLDATLDEIALSTLLLFSKDASELRNELYESKIKAMIFKNHNISENALFENITKIFHNCDQMKMSAMLSRMRVEGSVIGTRESLSLSDEEFEKVKIANNDFLVMKESDIDFLSRKLNIDKKLAEGLIDKAINLLIRDKHLEGDGSEEEELRSFISQPKLRMKKKEIYIALSESTISNFRHRGKCIDHIINTNTFDIYRALGRRTAITLALDANVAMPIMFGLMFDDVPSRYVIAAKSMQRMCREHGIRMTIPSCYLNEMAAHGRLALYRDSSYEALPEEGKEFLKASRNAYISHFVYIQKSIKNRGENLSLIDFLRQFGIHERATLRSIENKISSLMENYDIDTYLSPQFDGDCWDEIIEKKRHGIPHISEGQRVKDAHDASMLTLLKRNTSEGFVFVTWDKAFMSLVEDVARVLADTPARIIEFLSIAKGELLREESNPDILDILLYSDEIKASKLAEKIDRIRTKEQAYKLREIIDSSRKEFGESWELHENDLDIVLQGSSDDSFDDDALTSILSSGDSEN